MIELERLMNAFIMRLEDTFGCLIGDFLHIIILT